MLEWVIPTTWAAMRVLAFTLQLIGLLGLMGIAFIGLMKITDRILEVQDGNEDQDRSGEEDPSL